MKKISFLIVPILLVSCKKNVTEATSQSTFSETQFKCGELKTATTALDTISLEKFEKVRNSNSEIKKIHEVIKESIIKMNSADEEARLRYEYDLKKCFKIANVKLTPFKSDFLKKKSIEEIKNDSEMKPVMVLLGSTAVGINIVAISSATFSTGVITGPLFIGLFAGVAVASTADPIMNWLYDTNYEKSSALYADAQAWKFIRAIRDTRLAADKQISQ